MSLPKVSILYSNGNLLQDVAALDGIAAICGTGSSVALLGKPRAVFNLTDAEGQGFTEGDEPDMHRHLQEFYSEVGGNQELNIMTVPDTMTMAQMVDDTNISGAKKLLNFARGKSRLLGLYRKPGSGYNGGAGFIDQDVSNALLTSKTFGQTRLVELAPMRMLIEGRVQNNGVANTLQPRTTSNGFSGVVLGGTKPDGSASVGLALGRAVKYGAEIKLGKTANGPLSITQCYIGDRPIEEVLNLSTLHGDGFISFMNHPQKAGFYFGIDRMASTDDYRLLAYGRVIDKAAIVAAAVYIEELEGEVDVEENGNIASYVVSHLEKRIEQQINVSMGNQISGVKAYIAANQNIINTGILKVKIRIRPKGYKSFIDVDLGLTTTT